MSYGIIKVDTITFTANGVDQSVSVSGLVQNPSFSGNIIITGDVQASDIIASAFISGAVVTGNTAGFTVVTGATVTGTDANFVKVSGTTITGDAGQFSTLTGGTAGFTTITGTTVTGITANFVTVSGTTVTGNAGLFTTVTGGTGSFDTITGVTARFTTLSGTTVTGDAGQFTTLTGGTAGFTTVTGATVTGTSAQFTTGTFLDGITVTNGDINLNAQGDLRFADSDSSNWVAFQAPATIATNVTWTLPDADGSADQFLSTDGAGTLSWASGITPSGGTITGALEIGSSGSLVFEGSTADGNETTLTAIDPTADRTISLPDASGTVALLERTQTFTAAQRGAISGLTAGATITGDFSVANNFSVTLTGNSTLEDPLNVSEGQSGAIFITQDGTGGRTLAYASGWDFPGQTAPSLSTASGAVDVLVYSVRASGSIVAQLLNDIGPL